MFPCLTWLPINFKFNIVPLSLSYSSQQYTHFIPYHESMKLVTVHTHTHSFNYGINTTQRERERERERERGG